MWVEIVGYYIIYIAFVWASICSRFVHWLALFFCSLVPRLWRRDGACPRDIWSDAIDKLVTCDKQLCKELVMDAYHEHVWWVLTQLFSDSAVIGE